MAHNEAKAFFDIVFEALTNAKESLGGKIVSFKTAPPAWNGATADNPDAIRRTLVEYVVDSSVEYFEDRDTARVFVQSLGSIPEQNLSTFSEDRVCRPHRRCRTDYRVP